MGKMINRWFLFKSLLRQWWIFNENYISKWALSVQIDWKLPIICGFVTQNDIHSHIRRVVIIPLTCKTQMIIFIKNHKAYQIASCTTQWQYEMIHWKSISNTIYMVVAAVCAFFSVYQLQFTNENNHMFIQKMGLVDWSVCLWPILSLWVEYFIVFVLR